MKQISDKSVKLKTGYREMAKDEKREHEAQDWVEGLVGNLSEFEWFGDLDRLNSEPFMHEQRNQPPTPKRNEFKK